jgi:hypothetical protein
VKSEELQCEVWRVKSVEELKSSSVCLKWGSLNRERRPQFPQGGLNPVKPVRACLHSAQNKPTNLSHYTDLSKVS